jgi:signal transduction histidine kinase
MSPHSTDKYRWIASSLIVLVVLASAFGSYIAGKGTSNHIREQLAERSQTIAAALGPNEIVKLAGKPSDANTTTYKDLKTLLAGVKRANPDARSIYIMGQHDGRLFFYVDSEQPDSRDYSSAAEWYDDGTEADKAAFTDARPFVEGPVTDSYGTFISGLAPIFKPNSGEVLALVGIDVGADTYRHDVVTSAAVPALAGVSIVLIIGIFEWQRRRSRQLMALRSELVSVASHELRTPITGIRWAAESIQALTADDKVNGIAKAIRASADSMSASTADILELSRLMSSRSLNLSDCDLTTLVHEVAEAQKLTAQQRGVIIDVDPSWPDSIVAHCDRSQLKRALYNVIGNAIKYTAENTHVRISYTEKPSSHQITVVDQGIGIPVSEQKRVFRGFYRASNAIASKAQGSGLGLYLVKAVMEGHGGTVTIVSAENSGTTVTLDLPKKK